MPFGAIQILFLCAQPRTHFDRDQNRNWLKSHVATQSLLADPSLFTQLHTILTMLPMRQVWAH